MARSTDHYTISSDSEDSKGYFPGEETAHMQLLQHGNALKCRLSKLFSVQAEQSKQLVILKKENVALKEKLKQEKFKKEHYQYSSARKLNQADELVAGLKRELEEKDEVIVALKKKLRKKDELLQGLLERDRTAQEAMRGDAGDDGDVQEAMKDYADDDDEVQEVNIIKINRSAFKKALKIIVRRNCMTSAWKMLSLDDPCWQPFKTVPIEGSDEYEEVLDLDDGKLAMLMVHLGDKADGILSRALNRAMNSPSSPSPRPGKRLKRRRKL